MASTAFFALLTCSAAGSAAQAQPVSQATSSPASAQAAAAPAHGVRAVPARPHAGDNRADGTAGNAAEKNALTRFITAQFNTTRAMAARIVNAVYDAGERHQLSPSLLLAIISRESTFNPRATSGYGAQGLMQVVPRFHLDKLQEARAANAQASLFHPETNIDVGSRILVEYLDEEASLDRALAKYSGRASRYIDKVLRERDAFERVRLNADEAAGDDA
ncbi:transglycosylase SLT domain-containing protein [Azohydromonas aeria]|uniref:transglycosylase SLT domain-containing protein n=1 Tax=Azohydromonas aeria TaxID=2590212 RepID=UPI0012FAC7E2|nr:transglycosylase SLT domain-containing protein [Azohydromonas aeria]